MTSASGLDGINVTDQVSDRDVWRGEFFNVALFRREICNGSGLAALCNQFAAAAANGSIRVVVNLAAGDVRRVRIEQRR